MSRKIAAAQSLIDSLIKDNIRKRKEEKTTSGPLPPTAIWEAVKDIAQGSGMVYAKHPVHGYICIGCARKVVVNQHLSMFATADIEVVLRLP